MSSVDLWLMSLGTDDPEAALRSFALAFDLTLEQARDLTNRLPRVVQRDVSEEEATLLAERLTKLGAVAKMRPSAPALQLAPGSRPTRDSDPVPAAPPVSLIPRPHGRRHSHRPSRRPSFRPPSLPPRGEAAVARVRKIAGSTTIVIGISLLFVTQVPTAIGVLAIAVGIVVIGA